jgi:hypothetical protein
VVLKTKTETTVERKKLNQTKLLIIELGRCRIRLTTAHKKQHKAADHKDENGENETLLGPQGWHR